MSQKRPDKIYTWKTKSGKTVKRFKYYFSRRAANDKDNALYTSPPYLSRQGRNSAVRKEIDKTPNATVIRNTKP